VLPTSFTFSSAALQHLFWNALPMLIEIALGVYLVRGAPHIVRLAGFTGPVPANHPTMNPAPRQL